MDRRSGRCGGRPWREETTEDRHAADGNWAGERGPDSGSSLWRCDVVAPFERRDVALTRMHLPPWMLDGQLHRHVQAIVLVLRRIEAEHVVDALLLDEPRKRVVEVIRVHVCEAAGGIGDRAQFQCCRLNTRALIEGCLFRAWGRLNHLGRRTPRVNRVDGDISPSGGGHRRVGQLRRWVHRGALVILEISRIKADGFADENHGLAPARNLDQKLGEILEAAHSVARAQYLGFVLGGGAGIQYACCWSLCGTGEWRRGTWHHSLTRLVFVVADESIDSLDEQTSIRREVLT